MARIQQGDIIYFIIQFNFNFFNKLNYYIIIYKNIFIIVFKSLNLCVILNNIIL